MPKYFTKKGKLLLAFYNIYTDRINRHYSTTPNPAPTHYVLLG